MLLRLLMDLGYQTVNPPPRPRWPDFSERESNRAMHTYRMLGGIQTEPRLAPGSWDLSFQDLIVELDEELHFNRYRLATLSQSWSEGLPWSAAYGTFSAEHEPRCINAGSWGSRWTTASTEAQFGLADEPGVLSVKGAPRWKQRALYDSMKDEHAVSGAVRLSRLSIYDKVGGVMLGQLLASPDTCDLDTLDQHVKNRVLST